jgi:hypothetical protein
MAIVGEVLSSRVNSVLGNPQPTACPPQWLLGYYDAKIKAAMKQNGWCPSDVARITDVFQFLQTLHFLSKVSRIQSRYTHDECTEDKCNAYQINPATYILKHVDDTCNCEALGVDNAADVVKILQKKDCIPLLDISFQDDDLFKLKVAVVEQNMDTAFVAISHVG